MSLPAVTRRPRFLAPLPPAGAVRRQRLIRRICDVRSPAVVSAPAGYGKTMLLTQVAEASVAEWLWITCSGDITTSARLSEVIAMAFAERVPHVEPTQVATAADPWATLSEMTRGCGCDDVVVVLDAFERLPATAHGALRSLIARPPAGARVVLAGRRLPAFPLVRLRAEGLVEITPFDLAATADEARAFLAALGIDPDRRSTAALVNRSEGWLAALRLLAEAQSESIRPALDYVREEVVEPLPDVLVDFVVATKGPSTLSVSDATRLSGREDAATLMEELVRLQALTFRLSGAGLRVRYHRLLRAAVAPRRYRPQAKARRAAPPVVRLRCLGGLRVLAAGQELPDAALRRSRERTLLAILICARGPRHREELIDLLWPRVSLSAALASLHSCVYRLRKALRQCAGAVAVEGDGETYGLTLAAPSVCDVFELIARAPNAVAAHDRQELEALAVLGDGTFLPEWPYAEWARGLRAEVEGTYREVLEAIAHERTEAGDVNGAIGRYRRLLALEPEREGWHRELMRLYAAIGERALALRQYQTLAERLRTELGVEPCLETRELHRSLLVEAGVNAAG